MRSISISSADVSIDHAEKKLQSMALPTGYLLVRRIIELVLVIASLPLVLPLCLMIAGLVRLDSPGPILF